MFNSIISNFHFIRPWVLLFLLIPLLFRFYMFKNDENLSSWEKVCDKKLLNYLLIKNKKSKRRLSAFMMYLGLITAIISASGPSWEKIQTPALSNYNPVMIVLNLSTDMLEDDVKPTRLDRAKLEIKNILEQLKSSESGFIVYTDEPFLISPVSSDSIIITNLLDAVSNDIMPLNGDRPDRAIEMAKQKIKDAGYENGNIILFTADSGMYFDSTLSQAQKSAQEGISVNIVNMSADKNEKLEQIANAGQGVIISANEGIKELVDKIYLPKDKFKKSKNKTSEWLDFGWYLVCVPMICCLAFFRKGVLIIIFLISISSVSQADFLYSDNYLARKEFKAKNYKQAAKSFDNEKWKAAAYYKDGNYAQAIKLLADKNDIESRYNYANSLAKSGNLDEAIKTYEEVLKQEPEHKDAKYNLEYLKKHQQQNDSKNKKQNQNGKQDNQNKNESNEQNNRQNQSNQQNQNAEQKQDKDDKQQEAKAQNIKAQAQADQEKNNEHSENNSEDNKENEQNKKNENTLQQQKTPQLNAKQGDKDEKYDEQVQAKVQKFREIPDDKGGLLRAFIKQEYMKNRYGE